MRLPHRDPIRLGPTAYEVFQEKEGIPSVQGFFVEDLMDVEVKPWLRMGVLGSYLNLGEQQQTDASICEIPAGGQTRPQRHLFETLIYIHRGCGARLTFGSTRKPSRLLNGAPGRSLQFRSTFPISTSMSPTSRCDL
ncbi:MAG: hypothetical protein WD688_22790 [Candidatus Binatia bacterium]